MTIQYLKVNNKKKENKKNKKDKKIFKNKICLRLIKNTPLYAGLGSKQQKFQQLPTTRTLFPF